MNIVSTPLEGVVVVEPRVFGDDRGFFLETFRENDYEAITGPGLRFVQDNHSRSTRGVLRGLHSQVRRPQGKLVRCVRGEIFDVAVDIRPDSDTFGQWFGVRLSEDNKRQIYVPPGYAHGFQVVSDTADVEYKCTVYSDPDSESGLIWNDPDVGIDWPIRPPQLSAKDRELPRLSDLA